MTENTATLFGIANCDTVKKTRKLLDTLGVEYQFHDYKKAGLDTALASTLIANIPLDTLINNRGTTWQKLPSAQQESVDTTTAVDIICNNPSIVRRPLIQSGTQWLAAYDETQLRTLLAK